MDWRERERIWEKTGNIFLFLFVKTSLLLLIGLFMIVNQGCDKPWLPWNAGPSWSSGQESPSRVQREEVPQRPLENFCEDNEQTVENYRRFLEPDYNWGVSPEVEERRRRHCEQFVRQYNERCDTRKSQ